MSCSSASVGFWPSDLMTVPSSLVVMVPSPSLSNKEKASLNSVGTERRTEVRLLLLCAGTGYVGPQQSGRQRLMDFC